MRNLHVFADGQTVATDGGSVELVGVTVTSYPLDQLTDEEFRYLLDHWEERTLEVYADAGAVTLTCGDLSIPLQSV